jgi:hypothetical protein
MGTSKTRNSRVFTISFPEQLAQQVEQTAKEESRNISELFREAWRTYRAHVLERRLDTLRPIAPPNAPPVTQGEIDEFIHQVRSEMYETRKKNS